MADNRIQMPGIFGGLMRYDVQEKSKFTLSPRQVVAFVIGIIIFVLVLKFFWPVAA